MNPERLPEKNYVVRESMIKKEPEHPDYTNVDLIFLSIYFVAITVFAVWVVTL